MTFLRGVLAAATLSVMCPLAAQAEGVAAVLMVEDEQGGDRQDLTERLGIQMYERFLTTSRYARVVVIRGRENSNARLTRVVRTLARDHDAVDLFLSVHTTNRKPAEILEGIPPEARKLRLVYSTACHGAHHEREAWEAVGARTIVTHDGINNPLLALPFFLSSWGQGYTAWSSVSGGYRLTQRMMSFALSLPGMGAIDLPDVAGSRPVFTGDRGLRMRDGLEPGTRVRLRTGRYPPELEYSSRTGGPVGLALRALAHQGFRVDQDDVAELLDDVVLPSALPTDVLDQVSSARIISPALGKVELRLRREVEIPQDGVTLMFGRTVRLWAGEMHMGNRRLRVNISGLWVKKGLLRARINHLTIQPAADPDDGYEATARVQVYGFIPWTQTIDLGGERAAPIEDDGPIYRTMPTPHAETPQGQGATQVLQGISARN